MNFTLSRRRVCEHALKRDVLGRLDLLDDDAADGDIAVLLAGVKEVLVASPLVPDRNTFPVCEVFELISQPDNFRITDNRVNIEFEKFVDFVSVDEIGIPPQIIVPVAMVRAAAEKCKRAGVEQKIAVKRDHFFEIFIGIIKRLQPTRFVLGNQVTVIFRRLPHPIPGKKDFHGLNHSPQCGQRTSPSWFSSAVSVFSSACSSSAGSASLKKLSRSASE